MRYGCSPMSSRKRMPWSTRGRCGVPTRCVSMARLPRPTTSPRLRNRVLEFAFDLVAITAEKAPAMVERERRRRGGAEVRGDHGAPERRHPRVRERGQLERREIAVPEPSLPFRGERGEVDAPEEARPAVAAARRDRERHPRIVRHPADGGEPLVVARRESLPARRAARIDDDAMAERGQPRHRALQRRLVGHEARGGVETDTESVVHGVTRFSGARRRNP